MAPALFRPEARLRCGALFLKIRNQSSQKFCKSENNSSQRGGNTENQGAGLRERTAPLARKRSIWPLGRVTQISPIHSSFTPLIGLALKLVRLTRVADFPRSMVFK